MTFVNSYSNKYVVRLQPAQYDCMQSTIHMCTRSLTEAKLRKIIETNNN